MSRARTVTITRSITIDVEVTCEVRHGTPRPFGLTPDSKWVPGDEDAVVEILSIASPLGADLDIKDELEKDDAKAIEAAAIEAASDDAVADREEAAEAAADAAREERLFGGDDLYSAEDDR